MNETRFQGRNTLTSRRLEIESSSFKSSLFATFTAINNLVLTPCIHLSPHLTTNLFSISVVETKIHISKSSAPYRVPSRISLPIALHFLRIFPISGEARSLIYIVRLSPNSAYVPLTRIAGKSQPCCRYLC